MTYYMCMFIDIDYGYNTNKEYAQLITYNNVI